MTLANVVAKPCQPANVGGQLNLREPRLADWQVGTLKGVRGCQPAPLPP